MKKTIIFTSLLAAVALAGCNKSTRNATAPIDATIDARVAATPAPTPPSTDTFAKSVDSAAERTASEMRTAANTTANATVGALAAPVTSAVMSARGVEWKLTAADIKDDIAADRKIVRTKVGTPTGVSADKSALKASVQVRIRADNELATLPIDIDADKDGVVNLDGKANTIEQIGRAIVVALDTEGVYQVTSKVQLDKQGNARR